MRLNQWVVVGHYLGDALERAWLMTARTGLRQLRGQHDGLSPTRGTVLLLFKPLRLYVNADRDQALTMNTRNTVTVSAGMQLPGIAAGFRGH